MMPRALWLLDDGLILGGGQLFALRLAVTADRPVRIVCPQGSALWLQAAGRGIPCVAAEFPDPRPAAALALAQTVAHLRAVLAPARRDGDVVVSGAIRCSMVAAPALAARRAAPPLVHLLHERDSASRASVRIALRRSPRVVAVGPDAAAAYRSALPHARVRVVDNFLAPEQLEAFVQGRRPPQPGAPRIGVLARLIPEKGVAALVGELAAIPEAWTSLKVAGALQDVDEVARVRERVVAAGLEDRVALLGAVDDVAAVLAGVDVLLVPSVGHEGQPTVILEALAAGVPVVARRPLVSSAFAGLPVLPYTGPDDLAVALAALPVPPVPPHELARRFGPGQVLAALDEAAA